MCIGMFHGRGFHPTVGPGIVRSLVFWAFILGSGFAQAGVAVFVGAHPDDELTVSPLLAHYAKQGHDIYVACVTSGQNGNANTSIPPGDELGAAREAELTAACDAYGIQAPHLLQREDGTLDSLSAAERDLIKQNLRTFFESIGADVLITYGAEGYTGHPDHIAVGAMVTELLDEWYAEADPSGAPEKLYYNMFPASLWSQLPTSLQFFVPVNDAEATSIFDGSSGVVEAQNGVDEYVTQFPPSVMNDIKILIEDTFMGRIHLRLARTKSGDVIAGETTIFDGVATLPLVAWPLAVLLLLLGVHRLRRRDPSDARAAQP